MTGDRNERTDLCADQAAVYKVPSLVSGRMLQDFQMDRNVKRRLMFDSSPSQRRASFADEVVGANGMTLRVLLPNKTHLDLLMDGQTCQTLTVKALIDRVRGSQGTEGSAKKKQRQVDWESHITLTDRHGNVIDDDSLVRMSSTTLLLQDGNPDSVHADEGFWNVTPEPEMLRALPQEYTLFSALADELDNSLQAVWRLEKGKARLLRVTLNREKITIVDTGKGMDSTTENSIAKWGTIGSSTNREHIGEAIGGEPPYLKPHFGMYGFGGIGAGLHLGGLITVSSKTEQACKVSVLHVGKEALKSNVKSGSVWKTAGEIRAPTAEELSMSPHGSFTKVEITELNSKVALWNDGDVQRKLKDYYFPYIQNDESGSSGSRTSRPVEIQVNGVDLAEVEGGEVAITNSLSGVGRAFVLILEFTKPQEQSASEPMRGRTDRAHARIICRYFPIKNGRETLDEVLERLKAEDPEYTEETFDTFSRVAIRRLGRLLPDARMKRLPFMEPRKKTIGVSKECFKRVKAFVDLDAGFVPTTSKMDLVTKHPFTESLLSLGLAEPAESSKPSRRTGAVTVQIKGESGETVVLDQLRTHYVSWVSEMHNNFDVEAIFDENNYTIIVTKEHHRSGPLRMNNEVFQLLYGVKCRDVAWNISHKGGERPLVRLKLMKGLPGFQGDAQLYVTVECFIREGMQDPRGEKKIICRPIGVPPDKGSRVIEGDDPDFILGDSQVFPLDILFCTDKYEDISKDEAAWKKQEDRIQGQAPSCIELLSEFEALKFDFEPGFENNSLVKAGSKLPTEIVAVVRPTISKVVTPRSKGTVSARMEQKNIVSKLPLEMTLTVTAFKFRPPEKPMRDGYEGGKEIYISQPVKSSTRSGLSGFYCFKIAAERCLDVLSSTTGTYLLTFSLVGDRYKNVAPTKIRLNVSASDVEKWRLCTHSGECDTAHKGVKVPPLRARLGGEFDYPLFLSRFDEFNNPVKFMKMPSSFKCKLTTIDGENLNIRTMIKNAPILTDDQSSLVFQRIELVSGKLVAMASNHQPAMLRIFIDQKPTSMINVIVRPGTMDKAAIKANGEPHKILRPGEIIKSLEFQVTDKFGNAVEAAESVQMLLEGLELLDGNKDGCIKKVDANGCLDLSGRLRVVGNYGGTASIELRSMEEMHLGRTTFDVMKRALRIQNEPEFAIAGSKLKNIIVEAVDELGNVDKNMDGTSYALKLDWNPSFCVFLNEGVCSLPAIDLPITCGIWTGIVELAQHQEIQTQILVEVKNSTRPVDDIPTFVEDSTGPVCDTPREYAGSATNVPSVKRHAQTINRKVTQEAILSQQAKIKKILEKLKGQAHKVGKFENDLKELQNQKEETCMKIEYFQRQLRDVPPNAEGQTEGIDHWDGVSNLQEPKYGSKRILEEIQNLGDPPGTHAACLLLDAVRECENFRQGPGSDILGIVVLLAMVENDAISRALAGFLGKKKMTAIVCKSRSSVEFLDGGGDDEETGLHGFAKNRGAKISGSFRIITPNTEKCYTHSDNRPAINEEHPQKLLNLTSELPLPEGFLGYAVNLLHLNKKFVLTMEIDGHGLRETLFFQLFSYLQVYATKSHMKNALKYIKTAAVSLDGGMIIYDKDMRDVELGCRKEPMVRFAVDQNISLALQQNPSRLQTIHQSETMLNLKKMRSANDQILNQIANVRADLTKANNKLETLGVEYSTEMRDLNSLVSCIRRR